MAGLPLQDKRVACVLPSATSHVRSRSDVTGSSSSSVLVRLFTAFSHVLKPDVKDAFVQAAEDSGQLHVQLRQIDDKFLAMMQREREEPFRSAEQRIIAFQQELEQRSKVEVVQEVPLHATFLIILQILLLMEYC